MECIVERSDHSCHHRRVCLEVRIPRAKAKASYRTARNWRTFDKEAFLTDVSNVDWSATITRDMSCEHQWEAFSTAMLAVLDAHAPMRRFRVHNPTHPPITDDTIDLMNQRRSAKLNNDPAYHDIDVQTKRAIRKDCRDSISHRVQNSHPSDLFRQLRPIIAPKRGKSIQPVSMTPDEINQYFTSIGEITRDEVAAKFRQSGRPPLPTRLPRVNAGAMTLTPITMDHLKRVIFTIPNKPSPIHDDIPVSILKLSFDIIDRILLRIINKSFVSETVPANWKTAVVTPVHKRGDPSQCSNFRPITQVASICKVVEKIVHDQLTSYLSEQHLLSEDQHGFRAKHSTCTALLTVTDNILKGMNDSEITLLTLIDLSRCFDVVDHETLLQKLKLYQISTGWFRSYLSGHVQRTKIGDSLSDPLPITIGTLKGTCLGPLLYNIASNDISCHIPTEMDGLRITTVRYADDTQLAVTGPRNRITEMSRCLENVLDTMATWFLQHGMKVNAAKTEFIVCGDRKQLSRIEIMPVISFMGEQLESVPHVKNLGVIMDQNLSWNLHLKHVSQRCFGILVGLAHARHVLPKDVMPRLIDSLVTSHVRYCIQVYGNCNAEMLAAMQKIFNFSARLISNRRRYDHISDVLSSLNWLNARQFVAYFDLCLLHKIIASECPSSLSSRYRFNHQLLDRVTRQSDHLYLERPKNNHGKRAYIYRSSQLYNNFHDQIRSMDVISVQSFKKLAREIAASI